MPNDNVPSPRNGALPSTRPGRAASAQMIAANPIAAGRSPTTCPTVPVPPLCQIAFPNTPYVQYDDGQRGKAAQTIECVQAGARSPSHLLPSRV